MFTGVLEDDCTKGQIMSAKKTVKVIAEVNGHRYVSEYEGTDVVALTYKTVEGGRRVEGRTICNKHTMTHFIDTLFEQLPVRDQLSLLLRLTLKLAENPKGIRND